MRPYQFFDRDISWLSFNERVLMEASRNHVPLLERIKFLSIFSSNLDEFYRVRMPGLLALHKLASEDNSPLKEHATTLQKAQRIIDRQQKQFGNILEHDILSGLDASGIHLLYNEPIPEFIRTRTEALFFSQILAFLQPVYLSERKTFFPENNKLYSVALLDKGEKEEIVIINIPADELGRLHLIEAEGIRHVFFIEDIIKDNLSNIFRNAIIKDCYNIKITRDAELDLADEYHGDIAEEIEKQLAKRDLGLATRFLHAPGIPKECMHTLIQAFNLSEPTVVEGGVYHNLKDLASFPAQNKELSYTKWAPIERNTYAGKTLLDQVSKKDILVNPPYESYDTILRFINEASIDEDVEDIYISLYRVASDSKIVNSLISAAKNGKKVSVFLELKARFDEANNIRWAKKMKAAGVTIVYSILALKVHAKVALVKKRIGLRMQYYGLLATGNFNESTARFYTDHILLTSHKGMMAELELLFIFLGLRKSPSSVAPITFNHLLVSGFNLQQRFLDLIDREINNAKQGLPAKILMKLNNLEERVLISKLYEASNAGVVINIIARSICCLIPGIKGMSENITVKRIVDKYLEHGRIFMFSNNGNTEVFMGSADWMNRNIYRRIEVCFPVYDQKPKREIMDIMEIQWRDNTQAVLINTELNNRVIKTNEKPLSSQKCIYEMLLKQS
jgi:polyphosphate kinase